MTSSDKRVASSNYTGIALGAIVAAVLCLGTITTWMNLAESNERQISRIAESESFAGRSQLVRGFDTVLALLRNVRTYWDTFGHLPGERPDFDLGLDMQHVDGVRLMLWDDSARDIRLIRTPDSPGFGFRPVEEEWARHQDLVARARQTEGDFVLGPYRRADGSTEFEIVIAGANGRLVAVVNIDDMFDAILIDESPEFAVQIFSGDEQIYARGEPGADAPSSWIREGRIRSSLGTVWLVRHLPTRDMIETYLSPGIGMTLILGLIVAVLMGTLVFENNRARSRARAAEVAEAAVSEMNEELERLIEKRTKELEARTSDLQTLADSVAHDLRNPLNTLSVNIELLEDSLEETADDDVRTTVRRLPPCIDQMTGVLDRLLGMTTVAYSTFERVPVNMNELAEEIAEDLRASDSGPPIELVVADLPQAMADRTLTEILMINLLGNALKYTRKEPRREISVDAVIQNGETVYRISDNGVGFDENQAERIFEAFTRLEDAETSEGIGLGLTLVRKVIARHEGRIWAESSPGDGAMFCFTLEPPSA